MSDATPDFSGPDRDDECQEPPAKPAKKRTSSTRRKSGGGGKPKGALPAAAAAEAGPVMPAEPAAAVEAGVNAAEGGEDAPPAGDGGVDVSDIGVAASGAPGKPQESAATGVPAENQEPKMSPLVSQWLSRPLSPAAQERLERMRRTVPGYQQPSRPALTAVRVLSWALFVLLGVAVGSTLLGALDRSMETALVGGTPAQQAAQLVPAQEGQKVRVVNADGVNLRSQPRQGVTFVMVRLKKGTTLTLLASKPGEPTAWFKVRTPTGENGWVVDDKTYTQLIEAPK